MQELLTLQVFSVENKKLVLCWDEEKINSFKKAHRLEHVIICFARHKKTTQGLLKILFSGRARRISKSAGIYDYLTHTIVLFLDQIVAASIKGCSAKKPDEIFEKIKQSLPKITADVLSHELGHATEKIDFQKMAEESIKDKRVRMPILRTIMTKRIVRRRRSRSEKIAEEFAKQYAKELEPLFSAEEL